MFKVLTIALFTQTMIVLTGLAIMQITLPKKRLNNILYAIPYGWGIGSVVLYLFGYFFVYFEIFCKTWNYVALFFMLCTVCYAAFLYKKGEIVKPQNRANYKLFYYDYILIFLILIKIVLVTYICFTNPVMDSDALHLQGTIPIAKWIGTGMPITNLWEDGINSMITPLSVSILPAWTRMFLDRWYISFATIPWLFSYFSIIIISFFTVRRILKKITPAIICAYIISSLPILISHTIRPGYQDSSVAFFFMMAISIFTIFHFEDKKFNIFYINLIVFSLVGLFLTKIGGKFWTIFFIFFWLNHYLAQYKNKSLSKLILIEAISFLAFITIFGFLGNYLFKLTNIELFSLTFQSENCSTKIHDFFFLLSNFNTFNIFLWFVAFISLYTLFTARNIKLNAIVLYSFAFIFSVFYVVSFTQYSEYSLNASVTFRFLLHITGIFLPLYISFLKTYDEY